MRRRLKVPDLPEFPSDARWLNTERPLRMSDLAAKVVLLSFFTSCCVHCSHVIKDLRRLHARFEPDLAVIGVHSPKLSAERGDDAVREAVLRHRIDYPVVNDREMRLWRDHGVGAWPTALLISPRGRVAARLIGEGIFAALHDTIVDLLRDCGRSGELDHEPLPLLLERDDEPVRPLYFPAGILADDASGRLFISDTGHDRMIIADFDGTVMDIAGTGLPGLEDGEFGRSRFHEPRGLALDGNALYVVDRANHAIRRLDLQGRTVSTVAGTGRQALGVMTGGQALRTDLNSPWDLALVQHRLYITMAGAHQIWRLDLQTDELEPFVGGTVAGLADGSRSACLLAQPAGIVSDGMRLHFVDAATSSLRWAHLPPGFQLGTWIGHGIFEYGHRDGEAGKALLQHPAGIAHDGGLIYIADTYNDRVKLFNPHSARVVTVHGGGEASGGASAGLTRPRDLSCADGRLWVADTGGHAIRVAPLSGGPLTTLELHPRETLLKGTGAF